MDEKFNLKDQPGDDSAAPQNLPPSAKSDDWGMTNPLKHPIKETEKDGWKMPEPVFRVSDGHSPVNKSNKSVAFPASPKKQPEPTDEKLANLYAPPTSEEIPDITLHNMSLADLKFELPPKESASGVAIEPQPHISEQFDAEEIEPAIPAEKKPRSETTRLIFAILGVLAMILFAVGFLALVYRLFFYEAGVE